MSMSKTRVYKVKLYDVTTDKSVVSRRMATPEGASNMGGAIVAGTGYVVDVSELEAGEQWASVDFDPAAQGYDRAID
jgi:hypothetical protein